jgi:hypothetical protein
MMDFSRAPIWWLLGPVGLVVVALAMIGAGFISYHILDFLFAHLVWI